MAYDPTLPVNNSQISSAELRNQFTGLKALMDTAINGTAMNPSVAVLSQTISNPPTQAQVQAIQNKINELINAISRVLT